jgi:hypothetical protein
MIRSLNPGRGKTLFSSLKFGFDEPHKLLLIGHRDYFARVRGTEREIGHLPPYNAEVRDEWN